MPRRCWCGCRGIEPTGLFARILAECLRLQAAEAGRLDAVMEAVLDRLDLLAAGDLARLARLCGVTEAEIVARLRVIRSFDPKPGAQFDPGAADAREPDLVVTKGATGLGGGAEPLCPAGAVGAAAREPPEGCGGARGAGRGAGPAPDGGAAQRHAAAVAREVIAAAGGGAGATGWARWCR